MTGVEKASWEVNSFGFNLPCRQFLIAAERTKDRRLPMVDEFILRVLHTVERISPSRLARFFGFEGRDMGIAIGELADRNLVSFDGDEVMLHAAAQELFRTSDSSFPRLTTTERLDASVWFDLISKNLVGGRGLRRVRHLIDLRPIDGTTIASAEARSIFTRNFKTFLQLRGERNIDQWNLYSILDAHPGRYSNAQIYGSERLSLIPDAKMEIVLPLSEFANKERGRKLQEVIVSQLRERGYATPSQAAVADFSRLTGTTYLRRKMRSDGTLDLPNFLAGASQASDVWHPFIGHPYIETNRRLIVDLLANAPVKGSSLWWLRPGGYRWGLTDDLSRTIEAIRGQLRGDAQDAETILVAPHPAKNVKQHQLLFDQGFQAAPGGTALALEALVVPGALAVVLLLIQLSPSVIVPIGYASNDESATRRVWEDLDFQNLVVVQPPLWTRENERNKRVN